MRAQDCFLASAPVLYSAKGVKHNLLCQNHCSSCRTAVASGTHCVAWIWTPLLQVSITRSCATGFSAKKGTEAQRQYDWHSWSTWMSVFHLDEFKHWTWESKPNPHTIFTMVPWGLLLHTPGEASDWTHQPVWGHLSSTPPSSRRRIEPPRLAKALRESRQDRLHHTTMGWPSTGSVRWGQLPAAGVKGSVYAPSPRSPHPGRLQQLITAINLYH